MERAPAREALTDPIDRGMRGVLAAAFRLAGAWGLARLPMPGSVAVASGRLRGEPVEMRSHAFAGAGWESLMIAALADGAGALRVATVCGLPARGALRPLLGVDLVAFGGRLSLVALDLSPTDAAFWQEHARPLLEAVHARAAAKLALRRPPDFARGTLSPLALIAGARPGAEGAAFDAAAGLLDALRGLPALDPARPGERGEAAFRRNLALRRAELSNRKEADVLAAMFGRAFADRYLREHLFRVA
ncbi:hypothetical protein WME99_11805 [Sorangium sp. So ce136]|uniref:hypothetical protein n=1 Tax=Sorangium sp. So ce136 TaxID=3133284 RepID=UPI003F0D064B